MNNKLRDELAIKEGSPYHATSEARVIAFKNGWDACLAHQSPVAETDRDIADLIVYTVTECNANGDSYIVTKDKVAELFKRWHNELSHLEHPSSLTGDAVEFANYLHNNRWMPLDGYDRWEQEESKSVTSTEQLYKLFLSRDH